MGAHVISHSEINIPLQFQIVHLAVHLENGQRVYFTDKNVQQKIQIPPDSTLTSFFKLCSKDDFAKTLLYEQVPSFYTWDSTKKLFNKRKQGVPVEGTYLFRFDASSEMYFCRIHLHEC